MNDVEYEKLVDARVQRALGRDHRYLYAENAEEQAEAEEQITAEIEAEIERKGIRHDLVGTTCECGAPYDLMAGGYACAR